MKLLGRFITVAAELALWMAAMQVYSTGSMILIALLGIIGVIMAKDY